MRYLAIFLCPALLGLAVAVGQDEPKSLISSDLVAWSSMQQPRAPEDADPTSPPISFRSEPSSNVFVGSLVREVSTFMLRVSGTSFYQLDDQQAAQPFEGKRVRVLGTFDPERNLVHVENINLIF
ncbi:MAG: hypothetical protein JO356_02295 [Acidobacteria bacterium]|nr:hypothetical protein [Acidobacteriota bacterium]